MIWVTWNGTKLAHAADSAVGSADVRSGSFPLLCGRWAPDGWDKTVEVAMNHQSRCKRCAAAV